MVQDLKLAVIICTYNRCESLQETLRSLYQDGYTGPDITDIIVVANNCNDNTVASLKKFRTNYSSDVLRLDWINEPRPGKSFALNTAIKNTKHQVLCFVDDDQIVEKGFLENVLKGIKEYPDNSIFCGRIWPDWDGSEPSWVHAKAPYLVPIRPFPEFDLGQESIEIGRGDRFPGGGNITVRRSVFEQVGGFSTELGPVGHDLAGGEDHEFLGRATDKDFTIRYLPKVRQLHAIETSRTSTLYTLRKSFYRSRANFLISSDVTGIRLYMIKKPLTYMSCAMFTFNSERRFFYLVRLAASLGEFMGAFEKMRESAC